MGNEYNINIENLLELLDLGNLISEPQRVYGGLLHRMFYVKTSKGEYAIKTLNPEVMKRPQALAHYMYSEKISFEAKDSINLVTALRFNEEYLIRLDGQYYIIFDWVKGESIEEKHIDSEKCEVMGEILGKIHETDFGSIKDAERDSGEFPLIQWEDYSAIKIVRDNIEKLREWNGTARESLKRLYAKQVISHRDLDPKNVLWNGKQPIVIDWESAGYINQVRDILDTSMYWSLKEDGKVDEKRFLGFMRGYRSIISDIQDSWEDAIGAGFGNKLQWLEYSLKRALGIIQVDPEERKLGEESVYNTIEELFYYESNIEEIKDLISLAC